MLIIIFALRSQVFSRQTTTLKDTPPNLLFNKMVIYPHTYQLQKMDLLGDGSFGKGGVCRRAGNRMGAWDVKRQGCERWQKK